MNNLKLADAVWACIGLATIALAFEYWFYTVLAMLAYGIYRISMAVIGTDRIQERIQRKRTEKLYQKAIEKYGGLQSEDAVENALVDWGREIYNDLPNAIEPIQTQLSYTIVDLFHYERFHAPIPEPPLKSNSLEGARYRDYLSQLDAKAYDEASKAVAGDLITESLTEFVLHLPVQSVDVTWGNSPVADIFDTRAAVQAVVLPFYNKTARERKVFVEMREQLDRNICEVSGMPYSTENRNSERLLLPEEYPNTDAHTRYLKETPLLDLFITPVPVGVKTDDRWEHHWIVAATGHGKTQMLSSLILDDLERAQNGECSVVVMDSNSKLIEEIARLSIFGNGGALEDKLIVLDPQDDLPLALNLFDIGIADFSALPKKQQDKFYNATIEIYEYIISALIGADMTQKQGTLFKYVIRLLLAIPNANIITFLELMSQDQSLKYKPYMDKLDGAARTFFDTHFFEGEFKRSKPEIHRRLLGLLANTSFEAMFSASSNKLRLDRELDESKVILINTAKGHLGDEASGIFGRFFVGLIWQATKMRFEDPDPHPVYVYIDEAVEYFDPHIGALLRQARKSRIGLIMAHQDFEGVPEGVLAALRTNASIRMAGGIESPYDLKRVSNTMGLNPELINKQQKGSFLTSVRGGITNASIQFEIGRLSTEPKMSVREYKLIKQKMQDKYYYEPGETHDELLAVSEDASKYDVGSSGTAEANPNDYFD
ncbi:MAG: hypothetical protein EX270_01620 [Pseudomonadales bacterium]|nr:MAG: hypothetical protein EX270_01620 [Pseudomonadales bacterium]